MTAIVLSYFDSPGRAEPVRIALRLAGLAFTDRRLSYPAFAEAKAAGAFPLGSVPVLEVDGHVFTQTGAMLRFAARSGASWLYPSDPAAALRVDSALDTFNDTLSHALTPSLFERDPARKLEMRAAFAAGPMARGYAYVEGLIALGGGGYIGGAEPSIADLVMAHQVESIRAGGLDGLTEAHLAAYPRIVAAADALRADARVQAARG